MKRDYEIDLNSIITKVEEYFKKIEPISLVDKNKFIEVVIPSYNRLRYGKHELFKFDIIKTSKDFNNVIKMSEYIIFNNKYIIKEDYPDNVKYEDYSHLYCEVVINEGIYHRKIKFSVECRIVSI